jgi:hypothetical protein
MIQRFVSKSLADNIEHSYSKPEHYSVVTVPLPKVRDNDVLVSHSIPILADAPERRGILRI